MARCVGNKTKETRWGEAEDLKRKYKQAQHGHVAGPQAVAEVLVSWSVSAARRGDSG